MLSNFHGIKIPIFSWSVSNRTKSNINFSFPFYTEAHYRWPNKHKVVWNIWIQPRSQPRVVTLALRAWPFGLIFKSCHPFDAIFDHRRCVHLILHLAIYYTYCGCVLWKFSLLRRKYRWRWRWWTSATSGRTKEHKKKANEPKQCIAKKTKIGRCKYSKDLRIYFRFLIIQALEHLYSNLKNSKPTASKKEEKRKFDPSIIHQYDDYDCSNWGLNGEKLNTDYIIIFERNEIKQ